MSNEEKKINGTKHNRGRRKKKTFKSVLGDLLLLTAIGVFIFSGYKLYSIFSEYNEGGSEYKDIVKDVIHKVEPIEDENAGETSNEGPRYVVDFEKLMETNPDTVAWIRFEQPEIISYPVVQGQDNDKYLNTTFEGNRNSSGAIFIDVANSPEFKNRNTFIYGHNMKNGSMFGQLRKFKNSSYCTENPYFFIYTPDGMCSRYQIFSVCVVEDTSYSFEMSYPTDEAYANYISHIRSLSLYSVDVEVTTDSKIATLSTCTNVRDDERLLVHAVKIAEDPVIGSVEE